MGFSKKEFSFSRFVIIGVSLFLSKFMLLMSAYLLNERDYNLFNKFYYTAALIITFSILGFDYAFTRENISPFKILLFVILQASVFTFVLSFFDDYRNTTTFSVSIFIYAIFIVSSYVLAFKVLFDGAYISYFLVFLSYSVLHIILILAVPSSEYVTFFPFIGFLWLLIVVYFSRKYFLIKGGNLKRFYKLAVSGFIINSSLSLGIVFIKYVINNFFSADTANAFTFSWGIAAPVYYIGNMIEKYLFSLKAQRSNGQIKNSFILLIILITIYSLLIILILRFVPGLLPSSVDASLLNNIFLFMLVGYGSYCAIHFPINGYLFKFAKSSIQKVISISFIIIIIIYIILIILMRTEVATNYWFLLILFFAYIFTLLGVKTLVVLKSRREQMKAVETEERIKSVQEQTNSAKE